MKKEYLFILILTTSCFVSKGQTSSTLSGTTPLIFTSLGTGTYNKTVFYHQTNGLTFDLAKMSDSPSAVPINFSIDARGGGHNFFMINGSSGNVGIGTNSPNSGLEVLRTTAEGSITVNSGGSTQYSSYGWKAGGVRKWAAYQHPAINHALLFMNENGQDVFTMKQDGKIGINTIAPGAWLEVKTNSAPQIFLSTSRTFSTSRNWGLATNWNAEGDFSIMESTAYNTNPDTPRMTIDVNGNIGIGTTAPDAKLAVKGTVHANEVKVDLLGAIAPDYVFEKDYPLTSLAELKTYIDQYKHLPEIPSAKEMEKNGINLKEMNLLLLRKIEEMTLHLIDQNQQFTQLKEESRVSAEASAKKVEELTLYVIELKQRDESQQLEINELKKEKHP